MIWACICTITESQKYADAVLNVKVENDLRHWCKMEQTIRTSNKNSVDKYFIQKYCTLILIYKKVYWILVCEWVLWWQRDKHAYGQSHENVHVHTECLYEGTHPHTHARTHTHTHTHNQHHGYYVSIYQLVYSFSHVLVYLVNFAGWLNLKFSLLTSEPPPPREKKYLLLNINMHKNNHTKMYRPNVSRRRTPTTHTHTHTHTHTQPTS